MTPVRCSIKMNQESHCAHRNNIVTNIDKSGQSLARKTLIRMALRIALVVLVSAGVSFFYSVSNLEVQTQQQLQKYMIERGQRESTIFKLAQDNLTVFRDRLEQELAQPEKVDISQKFDQLYFRWHDGTLRNFPENRPIEEFDSTRFPTAVIGRNVVVTNELKRRLLTAYHLLSAYGPAWSNRFVDIYFATPENTDTNYWRGKARNLEYKSEVYIPNEEYFYVGDPEHNPRRKPGWTGLYLDTAVKIWMVSAIVPIYQGDRFLGIVGHDIVLTDLMEHTIHDQLPGTYNIIFREDGRIITHPHYMEELQQGQGQLKIEDLNDPYLARIFQIITHISPDVNVVENPQDHQYLGITRLEGPGWYFVTVYPESLLSQAAWDTAKFVLIAGVISLTIEILLLYFVLQQQVAYPLQALTAASNLLADGNFAISLDTSRNDELGRLAGSFTRMANQLKESFQLLEKHNEELEINIQKRTEELSKTVDKLKRTQLQMVQSEKMSSLGQLVAGVAHEINNPISFIHGNLAHVNEYAENLLKILSLYQHYYPQPPPEIQAELEALEIEFLAADLNKILQSMKSGSDRIRKIILSLRNFSRLDEAQLKLANLHEGIDNTLLILQHRLNPTEQHPTIQVIKNYGNLPLIECYPGQLNQVFINLLTNAIDALEEANQGRTLEDINSQLNIITITTEISEDRQSVTIAIQDNGIGMTEEVKQKIFDHFFTTKAVGKGTGLGLAIAYAIVVEQHSGTLQVNSTPGQGAEFLITIPIQANSKSPTMENQSS